MALSLSALDYTATGAVTPPTYSAQQDRLMMLGMAGSEGVRSMPTSTTGELAVTTTGAANGSVNVAAGHVLIAAAAGQGAYYAYNDATTVVGPFAANSSGNSRIDVVVVRITEGATPATAFAILQGTPAASPTAPTVTKTTSTIEIALAQVTIQNGFTTTTTVGTLSSIADVRPKSFVTNTQVSAATGAGLTTQVPSPSTGTIITDGVGLTRIYDGTNWPVLWASSSYTGYAGYTVSFTTNNGPTSPTVNYSRWVYNYQGNGIGKLLVQWQVTTTTTTWGSGAQTIFNLPLWNPTTAFAPITTGLSASASAIGTGFYVTGIFVGYPLTVTYQAAASGATPATGMVYAPTSNANGLLTRLNATAPVVAASGYTISCTLEVPVTAVY